MPAYDTQECFCSLPPDFILIRASVSLQNRDLCEEDTRAAAVKHTTPTTNLSFFGCHDRDSRAFHNPAYTLKPPVAQYRLMKQVFEPQWCKIYVKLSFRRLSLNTEYWNRRPCRRGGIGL